MSRSVADITEEALKLPEADRFKLVQTILESTEHPGNSRSEEEVEAEIARRIKEIDSGLVKGVPYARIDERLGKRGGNDGNFSP